MGYEYDMRKGLNDKLASRNELIGIIKKLDPTVVSRARRIAAGKEQSAVMKSPVVYIARYNDGGFCIYNRKPKYFWESTCGYVWEAYGQTEYVAGLGSERGIGKLYRLLKNGKLKEEKPTLLKD